MKESDTRLRDNGRMIDGLVPVRYLALALVGAALFLAGAIVGWWGHEVPPPNHALRESGYAFINPILLCNLDSSVLQNEDAGLSKVLRDYINKAPNKDVGVYYLNPTAGKWAGVNENESFSPASMLKVPIMTAVLRSAEDDEGLLSRRVYFDGTFDYNTQEDIKPKHALAGGQSYSIEQLMRSMVVDSDNNATSLLTGVLSAKEFENIYTDLGLEVPTKNGPVDFMSPKTFTLFLRVLYNGTYLSRDHSQQALQLMSQSNFTEGLRAGVPAGTTVAEKFGERRVQDAAGNSSVELHDCGIVYGKSPFLLCVMTRGKDFGSLAKEIADITKLVYQRL